MLKTVLKTVLKQPFAKMINNPEITLDEIAKEIGVGTTTIDREIAKITHLVKRVGPKNGGYWEIIED